jgi:hypothetical protein
MHISRIFHRFVTCKLRGHRSTGTFLWWMCDRCHATFTPAHSQYIGDVKISTERWQHPWA